MIKEVKKILRTLLKDSGLEIRTDYWTDAHYQLDYFGDKICQLFEPKPDEGLREELIQLCLKSDLRDSAGGHVGWIDGFLDQILTKVASHYQNKVELDPNRPKIICLCGSTRFVDYYNEWREKLTLEGKIVLSVEIVTTQAYYLWSIRV